MQSESDTPSTAEYDGLMPKPGRPRTGRSRRDPSEYPTFSFRVPEADAERLEGLLAEVAGLMNEKRPFGDPEVRQGRVLARAVLRGLEVLKRELSKG